MLYILKKYRFLCEGILYSCEIVILLLTCQGNSLYYNVKSMEINLTLTCKCSAIEEMIKKWWLRNCRKEAWKLFKGIGSCASKYMFGAKPN